MIVKGHLQYDLAPLGLHGGFPHNFYFSFWSNMAECLKRVLHRRVFIGDPGLGGLADWLNDMPPIFYRKWSFPLCVKRHYLDYPFTKIASDAWTRRVSHLHKRIFANEHKANCSAPVVSWRCNWPPSLLGWSQTSHNFPKRFHIPWLRSESIISWSSIERGVYIFMWVISSPQNVS